MPLINILAGMKYNIKVMIWTEIIKLVFQLKGLLKVNYKHFSSLKYKKTVIACFLMVIFTFFIQVVGLMYKTSKQGIAHEVSTEN